MLVNYVNAGSVFVGEIYRFQLDVCHWNIVKRCGTCTTWRLLISKCIKWYSLFYRCLLRELFWHFSLRVRIFKTLTWYAVFEIARIHVATALRRKTLPLLNKCFVRACFKTNGIVNSSMLEVIKTCWNTVVNFDVYGSQFKTFLYESYSTYLNVTWHIWCWHLITHNIFVWTSITSIFDVWNANLSFIHQMHISILEV